MTEGARAHNRWLAEFCSHSPERRAGVAVIPVPHDLDKSVKEIEAVAAAGLRGGIMIPTRWGSQLPYNDPYYDPIWEACAALDLPVTTHSGVGPDDYGMSPGLTAIYATEAYWWAARPLWALILGGVFERHPTLRYVLAENGAWWVPDIIKRMDSKWEGDHATRKFGPAVFRAGSDHEAERLPQPQLLVRRLRHGAGRGRASPRHRRRQPHVGRRFPASRRQLAAHPASGSPTGSATSPRRTADASSG